MGAEGNEYRTWILHLAPAFWADEGIAPEQVPELPAGEARGVLARILGLACMSTRAGNISRGRGALLSLPTPWVRDNLPAVADACLFQDPEWEAWEYRRLLEAYWLIDRHLVAALVARGLTSQDPDVREAAEDFQANLERLAGYPDLFPW